VHISNTDNPIRKQGERVSFDIGQNSRTGKLEAKNVKTSRLMARNFLDMEGVRGSIPLPPTSQNQPLSALFKL
jgi:hypothetical protein